MLVPWGHELGHLSSKQMQEDATSQPCLGRRGDRDRHQLERLGNVWLVKSC